MLVKHRCMPYHVRGEWKYHSWPSKSRAPPLPHAIALIGGLFNNLSARGGAPLIVSIGIVDVDDRHSGCGAEAFGGFVLVSRRVQPNHVIAGAHFTMAIPALIVLVQRPGGSPNTRTRYSCAAAMSSYTNSAVVLRTVGIKHRHLLDSGEQLFSGRIVIAGQRRRHLRQPRLQARRDRNTPARVVE